MRYGVNFTIGYYKTGLYQFVPSSIWDLISYDATTDYCHRDIVLLCNLKLKRKPEYFVLNPILLIVFVCILNLIVFIIPPDSGEKFIGHNFSLLRRFPVNFQR